MKQRQKLSAQHRQNISKATQGTNHWRTSLIDELAWEIFSMKETHTAVQVVCYLAEAYETVLTEGAIYSIWSGRTWSHVTGARRGAA